jgi:RNA polymerase sigma-70 factor (ECF subfamily)
VFGVGSTPSRQLARRELAQRVRQALDRLPEGEREVLVLRNLEGLTNQEAAGVLGIDPATASRRYGRAIIRLRGLLAEIGLGDPEP